MIFNISYWSKVLKKILQVLSILLGIFIIFKLSIFYMPFLIAFIISLIIEPLIRYIMKRGKLTRRTSSIIIFTVVSILLIGIISWVCITLFSETTGLLKSINGYFEKATIEIEDIKSKLKLDKVEISGEIEKVIDDFSKDTISKSLNYIKNILNGIVEFITKIPNIAICIGITVIALYFMCVDKIYILDQIEYHLPKLWVKKLRAHLKDIIDILGKYLKAEMTLVLISFIICLIGLYTFRIIGMNIEYPLLMALVIGFVDALPILGSGTIMIPWGIISALNGNLKLGISIIVLLTIMSITRQFIEPKIVSKNIGIHPIFTLIAMYTGFKTIGIIGLLIGPIALIVFKNIFASLIDKGFFKTIFDKK